MCITCYFKVKLKINAVILHICHADDRKLSTKMSGDGQTWLNNDNTLITLKNTTSKNLYRKSITNVFSKSFGMNKVENQTIDLK